MRFSFQIYQNHSLIFSKRLLEFVGFYVFVCFNVRVVWSLDVWPLKAKNQECQCLRAEDGCLSASREREFALPSPFCSIWALNGLDDAHPPLSALLSSPVWMLISSGNILTDTSRNNVSSTLWASLNPIKLAQNINHHKSQDSYVEILIPKEVGTLGWWDYEGRTLMFGISVIIREVPQSSLPLPPCEDTERNLWPRRGPLPDHVGALILDFQPPEPWEINFFCL